MATSIWKGLIAAVSVFLFISCSDTGYDIEKEKEMRLLKQYLDSRNISTKPQSSGLYYIPQSEGTGDKPGREDWAIIRYTGKLINDRIFDTTDERVAKSHNIFSSSVIYGDKRISIFLLGVKGLHEGLMLMQEGGTATLIMPSHLGYGSGGTGTIPPYATIIYDIELVKVIKDPARYEQELIDGYIGLYADSLHLDVEHMESGLYYIGITEGTGDKKPEQSNLVSVYYRGMLTDGRLFDTNTGGSPFTFYIGEYQAISGFEEGVKLMRSGGRARILIPSPLGYGEEGSGSKIPGFTPLVFDLDLINVQ